MDKSEEVEDMVASLKPTNSVFDDPMLVPGPSRSRFRYAGDDRVSFGKGGDPWNMGRKERRLPFP